MLLTGWLTGHFISLLTSLIWYKRYTACAWLLDNSYDNEASDDDDDDGGDVSDVAHPQTIVNVDLQRRYVDGNTRVFAFITISRYLLALL